MQRIPSSIRIASGIIALTGGVAFLALEFNPSDLLISFENRAVFLLLVFGVSVLIGFGAWSLSGYSVRIFAEAFLVIALWTFVCILPLMLLPIPADTIDVIGSVSLLALMLFWGEFAKRKSKRKPTKKEM